MNLAGTLSADFLSYAQPNGPEAGNAIALQGSAGGNRDLWNGGGGGGERIAICSPTNLFAGVINVSGGLGWMAGSFTPCSDRWCWKRLMANKNPGCSRVFYFSGWFALLFWRGFFLHLGRSREGFRSRRG